jgi:hypothetical protein
MQRLRTGSGDAAKITSRLLVIGILAIRRMAMLIRYQKAPAGWRLQITVRELFT